MREKMITERGRGLLAAAESRVPSSCCGWAAQVPVIRTTCPALADKADRLGKVVGRRVAALKQAPPGDTRSIATVTRSLFPASLGLPVAAAEGKAVLQEVAPGAAGRAPRRAFSPAQLEPRQRAPSVVTV